MFRARLSAFFLAANFFSVILFSMMASSSLVKGRKVGRLLSDSFSAWFSDMVGTSSGSGLRYHLQKSKVQSKVHNKKQSWMTLVSMCVMSTELCCILERGRERICVNKCSSSSCPMLNQQCQHRCNNSSTWSSWHETN